MTIQFITWPDSLISVQRFYMETVEVGAPASDLGFPGRFRKLSSVLCKTRLLYRVLEWPIDYDFPAGSTKSFNLGFS